MTDTLSALRAQNTREVWLLAEGDTARTVPPGTPGALRFLLARVAARDIRGNLLYAALGRDGYVAYANWYNAQAQEQRETAEASSRKPGDPEPYQDPLPDDAHWRAHSVALEQAAEEAILELGLLDPPFSEARGALGPYQAPLVLELVHWGRTPPAWTPDPEAGGPGNASSRENSAPP